MLKIVLALGSATFMILFVFTGRPATHGAFNTMSKAFFVLGVGLGLMYRILTM